MTNEINLGIEWDVVRNSQSLKGWTDRPAYIPRIGQNVMFVVADLRVYFGIVSDADSERGVAHVSLGVHGSVWKFKRQDDGMWRRGSHSRGYLVFKEAE